MICKSCGEENDDDRLYCISCMKKLKNKCMKCETIYDLSFDECPNCKTKSIKEIKVNVNPEINIFTLIFPLIAMILSIIILFLLNGIEYKTLEVINGNTYVDTKGLIDSLSFMLILNITFITEAFLSAIYIMVLIKKGYISLLKCAKYVIFLLSIFGLLEFIIYNINIKNENIYKLSNFDKSYIYDVKGIMPLVFISSIMLILLAILVVFEIILKNKDKLIKKNN